MNLPDLGGGYLGSRKEKDRYRHVKTNLAGFIELCPDKRIDKDQLKALIEEVPGVKSVVPDPRAPKDSRTIQVIMSKIEIGSCSQKLVHMLAWNLK